MLWPDRCGAPPSLPHRTKWSLRGQASGGADARQRVEQLLAAGHAEGYAFWFGACDLPLLTAWAELSPFVQLAIVDADASRVQAARTHLDALGVYGKITVHQATPTDFRPPRYVAQMVFVSEGLARAAADALGRHLCSGTALWRRSGGGRAASAEPIAAARGPPVGTSGCQRRG